MSARCGSCEAPVRWGLTTLGARMPLDAEPNRERGTVWITPAGRFRVLTVEEKARAAVRDELLWTSHFDTCPSAERHRGVARGQLGLEL